MQRRFDTLCSVDGIRVALPPDLLRSLAKDHCEFGPLVGHLIFDQGAKPSGMYIIETGSVDILRRQAPEEPYQCIATLDQGTMFGETSLLDSDGKRDLQCGPRSEMLHRVGRPCSCLFISAATFEDLAERTNGALKQAIADTCDTVTQTTGSSSSGASAISSPTSTARG